MMSASPHRVFCQACQNDSRLHQSDKPASLVSDPETNLYATKQRSSLIDEEPGSPSRPVIVVIVSWSNIHLTQAIYAGIVEDGRTEGCHQANQEDGHEGTNGMYRDDTARAIQVRASPPSSSLVRPRVRYRAVYTEIDAIGRMTTSVPV